MASSHRDLESPRGPASEVSLTSAIDVEKGPAQDAQTALTDAKIVAFEGPSDLDNPINWPRSRKWILLGLVSVLQLMV
jgi:hypothetical protein